MSFRAGLVAAEGLEPVIIGDDRPDPNSVCVIYAIYAIEYYIYYADITLLYAYIALLMLCVCVRVCSCDLVAPHLHKNNVAMLQPTKPLAFEMCAVRRPHSAAWYRILAAARTGTSSAHHMCRLAATAPLGDVAALQHRQLVRGREGAEAAAADEELPVEAAKVRRVDRVVDAEGGPAVVRGEIRPLFMAPARPEPQRMRQPLWPTESCEASGGHVKNLPRIRMHRLDC